MLTNIKGDQLIQVDKRLHEDRHGYISQIRKRTDESEFW